MPSPERPFYPESMRRTKDSRNVKVVEANVIVCEELFRAFGEAKASNDLPAQKNALRFINSYQIPRQR